MKSLAYHAAKLAIRPKGPLEEAIFEHIWQQTPLETVLAELVRADVHLFAQATLEAIAAGAEPRPLVTRGDDGKPAMLVFSSEARAAATAKGLPPGAASPLTQPFSEVLRWAPIELGLAINLGSALAAGCTSAHMDVLRRQAGVFRP
ncbi:MAG TPA: SseB family protein [Burkholderiales bacterium]|nr:SseB family protein [Burkholderiales bacterium]